MCECSDLIGRPYRLGADGTGFDGAIDCIHLVFDVHRRLGLSVPVTRQAWYQGRYVARDMLTWWRRIDVAEYDGDVLLIPQPAVAFSVFWKQGCLYINQISETVAWCPIGAMPKARCFRSKSV